MSWFPAPGPIALQGKVCISTFTILNYLAISRLVASGWAATRRAAGSSLVQLVGAARITKKTCNIVHCFTLKSSLSRHNSTAFARRKLCWAPSPKFKGLASPTGVP